MEFEVLERTVLAKFQLQIRRFSGPASCQTTTFALLAHLPTSLSFMPIRRAFGSLSGARAHSITVVSMLTIGLAAYGVVFATLQGVLIALLAYPRSDCSARLKPAASCGVFVNHAPAIRQIYRQYARRLDDGWNCRLGHANSRAATNDGGRGAS
jgi:hypothetical protein